MNRCRLIRLFIGLTACGTCYDADAAAPRPNLILIMADDMRHDMLGVAGNRVIQTPHLDALAKDGTRFRNMFVTTSICTASRASVLTGLYERTHKYTFNSAKPISAKHWSQSYPVLLKQTGYRTEVIGKIGVAVENGGIKQGFDHFIDLEHKPYLQKQTDGSIKHLTDIEGDLANEFVNSCSDKQPFYLSLSFSAPHATDNAPEQYFWSEASNDLYRDTIFPIPKTMSDEFFQRQPKFLRESESRVRFHWRFDEPEKYQKMVRGYYRMITDIDRVVGRLRDTLKQRGLDQNTVIVFTSDNGNFLGERGFADKWYLYEPSVRVPLIIHDPRAATERRGQTIDAMSLNVDLTPTLLDLAGIPLPTGYQGQSLSPWLQGLKPANWRTDFFYEHLFEHPRIPKSEGVRTEKYAYIRWFEQQPLVEELYDHQADPDEAHNLVNDPKYSKTLEQLRQRTTALRDQYGGPFVSNLKPSK